MSMVYKWKSFANFKLSPQVAGEELERIRASKNRPLIAADVVNAAKAKSSPLHGVFEWDDKKAAHQHRLTQASELIRSVAVVSVNSKGENVPVRAFVNIGEGEDRGYTSIATAMSDEVMRAQVLARAWAEIEAWKNKYQELVEFSKVFELIDDASASIKRKAA